MKREKMKTGRRVKLGKVLIFVVLFAAFLSVGCASAATYTVCPSGCNHTSIQAAINAAGLGDTIEVHSGTYYENVNVTKQLFLMGVDAGSGKPVVDAGGSGSVITLSENRITLEGFTVTNSGGLQGDRIKVLSSNNTITNNNVSNNVKDCIYLYFSSTNSIITSNNLNNNNGIYLHSASSNNNITGNTVSDNNGNGIYLFASNNNTITGNNICNNWDGITLSFSSNNTITSNTFVNNGFGIYESYQNTAEDNIVNGKPLVYLEDVSDYEVGDAGQVILVNCDNITVENQNLSNTDVGITLWETENSRISNNNVSGNNVYGIRLQYSSNNTITDNNISNSGGDGIHLRYSSNNTITDNNISKHFRGGITLSFSSNNTITGNNININLDAGITLSSSSNNAITGNNISNHPYGGITLSSSSNNTITGNNVCNNWDSISLYVSSNNTITGNNLSSNNEYGIRLNDPSSNNKIYLNNFINNMGNVYSEGSSNIWNATEKITYTYNGSTYTNYLGNYWSDYSGSDNDNDGIGDTPYSIYSNNDTYPLIQPWENYFAPAPSLFDTGPGTYPSIMGTHTGTIIPSQNITANKLYTYPCAGTSGHTGSINLYENSTLIANGTWDGYKEDWHNITLHNVTGGTPYVTLLQDHEYNYTIHTGSYPQILHATSKEVTGGTITCSSFVDTNGNIYTDWIPAIKLF